ncbi:M24 family metallopeptidase [Roseiconus lacunae]|uniref:M24 family metallopeptidase n=1 Tax=Roseiconus lacunae TaxID=2605694 RepID=UPI0011F24A6D|nr:Xaa-Pro peptidase family protein [Roseiconus lacunae]MCD0463592.1 Xaa-Pro peptidase family protein [Roseiconus lacunae]WRQ53255.1 Xaa-Pro peptidase family protein [Stieleria sp. HD01]
MSERIKTLTKQLDEIGADAFYVVDEINVRYLTGFTGDSSSLLISRSGALMLSDGRYKEQLDEECPGLRYEIKSPSQRPDAFTADVLAGSGAKKIAIESDSMTVAGFNAIKSKLPEIEWVDTSGVLLKQRMIKDSEEIEVLRSAVRINERALQSVLAKLGPDWTELEVAYELESTIRRLGATGFSFDPIIGAGPGGAKPHYSPDQTVLGDHSTLLIDWGTKLGGYASDLTRCFHYGNPPAKFAGAYQAVLDSQLAAIDAIRPGATAKSVDEASRSVLKKAGLAEYFVHGLGHGVGLQIHESPRLSGVSEDILQPGMVITVEPGVYFEGEFGIRIEDDILVTEDGNEVLSGFPKGLDDCHLIL